MALRNVGRDARGCLTSIVDVQERFWSFVAIGAPDACWEWQGGRNPAGYGYVQAEPRKSVRAHRLAYEAIKGPLRGLALHRCDNPPCCNPNHLVDGRIADGRAWGHVQIARTA